VHTKTRRFFFFLVLSLSALARADFRTVGVYDPDDEPHHNQVDQSGVYDSHTGSAGPDNVLDLTTFRELIGRAFEADAGGVIDGEGPDDNLGSDDIVIAHFGTHGTKSVSFEHTGGNLNLGDGGAAGNRLPLSGDHRFSKSGGADFSFNVGEVSGGGPGEVITFFAGSLIERDDRDPAPVVLATFSDGSTVTATADMAGDDNSPNSKDTFFGFQAPTGASIVSVEFALDTFIHLDDAAFITSAFVANSDLASSPSPATDATDVPQNVPMSWMPAQGAAQHDVYLGKDMDAVQQADRSNPANVLVSEAQNASTFSPAGLEFGQTYYWRVDEVHGATIAKGNIWSLQVEPLSRPIPGDSITATASSHDAGQGPENTTDGSGLENDMHSHDVLEMWLSDHSEPNQAWIQYTFDKAYRLDQVMVWNHNGQAESALGWGIKNALIETSTDGIEWMSLGVVELTRATVAPFSEVDLQGVAARSVRITAQSNWGGLFDQYGLSEVRFETIPVHARELTPAQASVDVDPDVALSWRAGREAETHEVYVGRDPNTLPLTATVTGSPYGALDTTGLDLHLGQTYYWQINEVNEGEVPTTWEGDILRFSTRVSRVVEDFEGYTNISPDRPFQTWLDGFGFSADDFFPAGYGGNDTGSGVGHDIWWSPFSPYYNGDIMEKDSVHGGEQSVPISYGNGGKTVSEVDRIFEVPQDWTINGIQDLVVHYQGFPAPLIRDPNGTFRLTACGDNMMANTVTADGCRFVYKTLSGDGSIIAKLESHPHIHNWGRVGVMIRENLDPGAVGVSLYDAGANGLRIGSRDLAFTAASHTGASTMGDQQDPVWLKLERTGQNINAFYTPDLATQAWIPVDGNPWTIPMGGDVQVGLALTSRYSTRPVTAVFTDVSTSASGVWQIEDLGDTQPINTPAQLYAAVEDAAGTRAIVNHEDGVDSVLQGQWTAWRIQLSDFTGVDLSQIKTLTLGVGNTELSGTGLVLIDDIELQPKIDE
jgi:hypothetical protein